MTLALGQQTAVAQKHGQLQSPVLDVLNVLCDCWNQTAARKRGGRRQVRRLPYFWRARAFGSVRCFHPIFFATRQRTGAKARTVCLTGNRMRLRSRLGKPVSLRVPCGRPRPAPPLECGRHCFLSGRFPRTSSSIYHKKNACHRARRASDWSIGATARELTAATWQVQVSRGGLPAFS